MGIGRNSWKKAKENAKAEGKKIRDAESQHFMSKSFSRIPQETVNEITPTSIPWGGGKKTKPTMEPDSPTSPSEQPSQKPKSPLKFAGGAAIAAGGLQSNFGLGNPATQVSAFEKLRGMGNQMSNTFASNRMAKINRASPCAKSAKSKK